MFFKFKFSYHQGWLIALFVGLCAPLLFDQLLHRAWIICALLSCVLLIFHRSLLWVLLCFFSGWYLSNDAFLQHAQRVLDDSMAGKDFSVSGTIVSLPDKNISRTRFTFRLEHAYSQQNGEIQELSQSKVILSCYRCRQTFESGQRWRFVIRLKPPNGYASWGAFDYEKWLFRKQLVATGYVRTKSPLTLLGYEHSKTNKLRAKIGSKLEKVVLSDSRTTDHVGLGVLKALLIGDKSSLSQQHKKVFQWSGISHLMAISGLHVGLVFLVVLWLGKWLLMPFSGLFKLWPRQQLVLIPALLAASGYAALAGFAVSTQRALIMLLVFCVARLALRSANLLDVLLIAAVLILLLDPFAILDAGFWLSCCAVFVIGLGLNAGLEMGSKQLSLIKLQPMLWLGMMPLTVSLFGYLSLISPLVNLIVVPVFCLLLIPASLLMLCCDMLGLNFVSEAGFLFLSLIFDYLYMSLDQLSQSSWWRLHLPALSWWWWLAYVLVLSLFVLRWKIALLGVLVWFGLTLNFSIPTLDENEVRLTLLDVGQGLSMVIELDDYVLVYDTGPAYRSGFNAAESVLIPYLRHRGIKKIDQLIVSHADNDHIGGLPYLLDAFTPLSILTSRVDKISQALACRAGQTWQINTVKFEIVSPDPPHTPQGSNNYSCVLKMLVGEVSVLITGDIEKQVERHLLTTDHALAADIMLVPHQGSKTSSTKKFITAVQPSLALIAAGYLNHYGHPHPEVVDRYNESNIALESTIDSGSISLKIINNNWQVMRYRQVSKGFWNR